MPLISEESSLAQKEVERANTSVNHVEHDNRRGKKGKYGEYTPEPIES